MIDCVYRLLFIKTTARETPARFMISSTVTDISGFARLKSNISDAPVHPRRSFAFVGESFEGDFIFGGLFNRRQDLGAEK
ncbi:MAG: hypothetical protein ACK41E_04565 [Deinococcales bacterium]